MHINSWVLCTTLFLIFIVYSPYAFCSIFRKSKHDSNGDAKFTIKELYPTRRRRQKFYLYVRDIPKTRTKQFHNFFLVRVAMFPVKYSLGIFNSKVNRYLLPQCINSSSLTFSIWCNAAREGKNLFHKKKYITLCPMFLSIKKFAVLTIMFQLKTALYLI